MSRVYNFSAGPAVLPEEVLQEAADEMLDYRGCGMSVMEMSHRSGTYQKIIDEAEADLRQLMGIPDNYKVLFLQGGASQQFAMIPMNLIELATASRYQIPIIQIIINNHVLGMVRQWQTLFYGKRYSQTVLEDAVDYCKVAEGLGCAAIRVTAKEEVAPAIEKAIALQKPVVIDCRIPEDDKVFPMVPAGAAISEVFDGDDLTSK